MAIIMPCMARFLRWVGGKDEQLALLLKRAPSPLPRRYLEVFVGGGALFFKLYELGVLVTKSRTPAVVLADANERLIRCYRGVRQDPARVASIVEKIPVTRATYAHVRDWQVDAGTDIDVAAWLIYVNHAGYGGLYRTSREGRFNTPFDASRACSMWAMHDRLRAASIALRCAELVVGDYVRVLHDHGVANTFSYLDPPYLAQKTEFTAYTGKPFDRDAHHTLAFTAGIARSRGCKVLASNSELAVPLWRAQGFHVELHDGGRMIGRGRDRRAAPRAAEMLARGY